MRRLFWVSTGALLGVTAYRRVSRLARAVSGIERPAAAPGSGGTRGRVPEGWARGAAQFARDVRDGMELYTDRHPELAGRTREGQQAHPRHPADQGRGRAFPGTGEATRPGSGARRPGL